MTEHDLLESVTAIVADCIHDEGFDLVLADLPIEYGEPLQRVARHCADVLLEDGFLDGGGAERIEKQRKIIHELCAEIERLRTPIYSVAVSPHDL